MRTISIISLKGGTGKTTTAVNMAYILATVYAKRVLLFNNDKQGDASKLFRLHSYDRPSAADILTEPRPNMDSIILRTGYENLDLVPANMHLISADAAVLIDHTRPQQTRYAAALRTVADCYDYCIIDNQPDINMHTINALAASDEVIVPLKLDEYALDGLQEIVEQIDNIREHINPGLAFRGCLVTMTRNDEGTATGEAQLYLKTDVPVFTTRVRFSDKVTSSTYAHMPTFLYSRGSAASVQYGRFVREYLEGGGTSDLDTCGGGGNG